MKIKCFYNSWLAKVLNVEAITLYPFIFFSGTRNWELVHDTIAHEYVHILQVRKLGWFRFYASYLWIYFRNRFQGMSADEAYYAVPYEQEAYEKQTTQKVPTDFGL